MWDGTRSERRRRHRAQPTRASLVAVEESLLEQARGRAQAILEAADSDVHSDLDAAQAGIRQALEEARAKGAAAAALASETRLAEASSEARLRVLAAKRRAYDALRAGALDELRLRAGSKGAVGLNRRLAALARQRLGPAAKMSSTLTGACGLTATAGSRQVSVTAEALVDHELEHMAAEVEELWA